MVFCHSRLNRIRLVLIWKCNWYFALRSINRAKFTINSNNVSVDIFGFSKHIQLDTLQITIDFFFLNIYTLFFLTHCLSISYCCTVNHPNQLYFSQVYGYFWIFTYTVRPLQIIIYFFFLFNIYTLFFLDSLPVWN